MRVVSLALIALTVVAAPAEARRAFPALPLAPRGVDYVESTCTGGIDGRYEVVRVLANGQVQKMTRRSGGVLRAKATRGEVGRIWRSLDLARFERRIVKPETPTIADGVDCSLARSKNGRVYSVVLTQQVRGRPQYRDLAYALDEVNALGQRAIGPILRPAAQP